MWSRMRRMTVPSVPSVPSVMNAATCMTDALAARTDEGIGLPDPSKELSPSTTKSGQGGGHRGGRGRSGFARSWRERVGGRIDVRHADPLAGGGPASAGDERVNVRMGVELIPERLGHRDHTGTKALLLAGRHGHQLAVGPTISGSGVRKT